MKFIKHKHTLIISIIASLYLLAYLLFLRESKLQILFLGICIVLLLGAFFLLGRIAFNQTMIVETHKLKDELNIQKSLVKAIEDNNELVSKSYPVGIIVYDDNYVVTYSNTESNNIFNGNILEKSLRQINPSLVEHLALSKEKFVIDVYKNKYKVSVKFDTHTIYLFDATDELSNKKEFEDNKTSLIYFSVDNSDCLEGLSIAKRSELTAKYYQGISAWAKKYKAYGYSPESIDVQKLIIKEADLEKLIKDEFSIIDIINQISKEEGMTVTVSIGVGTGSLDFNILGEYAEKALEFAQDRGGSQAVIFDGKTNIIFGGNVLSSERKPKTSVRIFYNNLTERIKQSSSVLVMPHIDTDADAFGSALGVLMLCEAFNTPCKILLNNSRIDSSVKRIIDASKKEFIKLSSMIIDVDELPVFFTGDTTLVLVDHHKKELSVSSKPYSKANYISIIDHHRITESIEIKTNSEYIDHSASSTVELMCNLLNMYDKQINIPSFISTAMLTGILVDTSNYTTNVSSETYDACSFLSLHDADSLKAKLFLRESVESQIERLKLFENVEILFDKFAFITYDNKIVKKEDLAKVADELLNIENISASFVIGLLDKDTVGVSSRSDSSFNIHREMERLGGGGHFNKGASQIKGRTIESIKEEIINNIKSTIKGDSDFMKVILIEDVKKQGKKGDIIECTPGYANFLMGKKLAVEANQSNLSVLESEKAATLKLEQEELDVAKKTKQLIEETTINVFVKLGENGKFFGSINAKQLSDALKAERNIDVDKRKISLEDKIEALGTYKCFVKLHKEVTATLSFNVKQSKE